MPKIEKTDWMRRRLEELDLLVHKDDFLEAFKKVLEYVKKIDERNRQEVNAIKQSLNDIVKTSVLNLDQKSSQILNGKLKEIDNKLANIRDGIDGIDGRDGKDADPEYVIKSVLGSLPRYEEQIDKLKKEIKRLKKERKEPVIRRVFGGGGFSAIAMNMHFIDNETPTGTINGTNKVFTLAGTPNPVASLKLYLDGQLMKAGGTDYTLSGNTITFVAAPLTNSILLADYRT